MNRNLKSFGFGCIAAFLLSPFGFSSLRPCPQSGASQKVEEFRSYTIRIVRTEHGGCLEVRKSGVLVYRESDSWSYGIGNRIDEDSSIPVIPLGTDITGGGVPDAIVWSWSGGLHCCFAFQVLQLGKNVQDVADISAEDSDGAHFADLRHNGHYEFVGRDWDFAYWNASFGESPAPEIILRPSGVRMSKGAGPNDYYDYNLDLNLMWKPAPTPEALRSVARKLRAAKWQDYGVPPQLWGGMLNLIYTGHPGLAWKLLDETWPNKRPGKQGFIGAFCGQLDHSLYSNDLKPLLKNAPADCNWETQ